MGVKCALPDRPVVCFTGDGGIWYHLSELETAVRRGINTVTVVLNNHALVFDTHILDARFAGKAHDMAEFTDVDFGAVARSMGAFGIRVNNLQELKPALDQAFASNLPAVVDVVIDHEAYAPIRGGQTMFSSV
jgi:acetolactate synthase-1/2/3 large subunit